MRPCASGRASSGRPSPTRSGVGCPVLATNGTWTVCHEHISRAKEVWRCTRDEGRPLEVRSQVPASNPCKLRSSRAIVVSVAVKGGRQSRQVRSGEASESERLRTCRKANGDVKTGGSSSFRDQVGGCPEDCPSDIRHGGGPKPDQARVGNVRTCRSDAKGDVQAAQTARIQSTEAGHRGGAARRREEGSVMELDQRGCSVLPRPRANRYGRSSVAKAKPFSIPHGNGRTSGAV